MRTKPLSQPMAGCKVCYVDVQHMYIIFLNLATAHENRAMARNILTASTSIMKFFILSAFLLEMFLVSR